MDEAARRAYVDGFGAGKTVSSAAWTMDECVPGWRDNRALVNLYNAAFFGQRPIGRVRWAVTRALGRMRERLRRGR